MKFFKMLLTVTLAIVILFSLSVLATAHTDFLLESVETSQEQAPCTHPVNSRVWLVNATNHTLICSICLYTIPNTHGSHSFTPISFGNLWYLECTKCGYRISI